MMVAEKPVADTSSTLTRLQHFTQNEVSALRSIYNYYKDGDDGVPTSVICLAIINDLGRNSHERSCMKRAIEEFYQPTSSRPPKSTSFLSILDHGRKLYYESQEDGEHDDMMSQKYFLRLLNDSQQRCTAEGKYLLAEEFNQHELRLVKEEESRQADLVTQKHNRNRNKIVVAHAKQIDEFRDTWGKFMDNFEQQSQDYIQELDKAHIQQLCSLKKSISEIVEKQPKKWSRDLIQYRKRQSLMADQQRYQEAQQTKLVSDALEEKERANMNSSLESSLQRKERNMKKQHQAENEVLMKRIDSKRTEYVKQRDEDCSRLLQRNKNIQAAIDSKHVSECMTLASKIEQHVKSLIKDHS